MEVNGYMIERGVILPEAVRLVVALQGLAPLLVIAGLLTLFFRRRRRRARTTESTGQGSPRNRPKPVGLSDRSRNRPVVGAILSVISFAPLVGAALFGAILPCKDEFGSYCKSADPILLLAAGAVATILGLYLVHRKCFPKNTAKQKMIRKQRKAKDVTPEKITTWDRGVVFSVIVGLSTTILYWIFADTPVQCVGRAFCQSDDRFMVGILFGVLAGFVVWAAARKLADAERRRKMTPEEVAASQAAAKIIHEIQQQMGWDSVPKVVCPHCQETGAVQHFTPYEAPRDLLKEGLMWHLTDKTIGHVEVAPAEKIGRDIREASQVAQTPNMRCTNCTINWRV